MYSKLPLPHYVLLLILLIFYFSAIIYFLQKSIAIDSSKALFIATGVQPVEIALGNRLPTWPFSGHNC